MKILQATKTDIQAAPLYVAEVPNPGQPIKLITVSHVNPKNPTHVRSFQITNNHLIIKRAGQPTVGIDIDSVVHLLSKAIPESSWPPYFIKHPVSVIIKEGDEATLEGDTQNEHDEISTTYQWQQWTGKKGQEFEDCPNQTSNILKTGFPALYRLKATNVAGTTFSIPAKIDVIPNPVSKPPVETAK